MARAVSSQELAIRGPLLIFEQVTKRYARPSGEIVALDKVSFTVAERDFFTIRGSAASGKTTLLRLAAGLELPDLGSVRFRGRDTAALSHRDRTNMLRHELGCVFEPDAARETVDFVAWPLISARVPYRQAMAEARKMLRRVGAEACAGARLAQLSASERMRVTIAQACVRKPLMLIADEPAKTLDGDEADAVLALLRSIAADGGMAVLMTTGDATRVGAATQIGNLQRGRLRVEPRGDGELVELRRPSS